METRFGRLTLQASDRSDVFAVVDVINNGFDPSDEIFIELEDIHFESSSGWLDGKVPVLQPVEIDGDNTIIRAWFQGERYVGLFTIRIYIEYEEVEEMIGHDLEPKEGEQDDCLEQKEVIL